MEPNPAKPVHIQVLERALDIKPLMQSIQTDLDHYISSNDTDLDFGNEKLDEHMNSREKQAAKCMMYKFEHIENDSSRVWMKNLLLSDSSDDSDGDVVTEADYMDMLANHKRERKIREKCRVNPMFLRGHRYYSTVLFSSHNLYKPYIQPHKERKYRKKDKIKTENSIKTELEYDDEWDEFGTYLPANKDLPSTSKDLSTKVGRKSKKALLASVPPSPEVMALRRRKLWIMMGKKEVGKVQRAKNNNHKEQLQACKRTAQLCMKMFRQQAMQSQKNMKETVWRCKRLTREMQAHWKRYDRVEREMRRRAEREAEEQRKIDVEMIEAKRQQRKLNFLITQTELYAHFMSKKIGQASPEEQLRILSQLDEQKTTYRMVQDDYDSQSVKEQVKRNVIDAIANDKARTKQFDLTCREEPQANLEEHPQPTLFKGVLKGYQLKGMNWLANLYDQGISGILADEMGLGKTIQSIAFLSHVAEKYSVWGPFLIISPASTLHNWQQEMARFAPDFRVVPYWGNPNERKILRQFWNTQNLHTKNASFHVVITSYQIIITDIKYFNRLKWQYMILDEAQAIKSASSVRWKMLLGFSCRNRLLLSGTPIQNSMAELWALLHFIMPTLFDSHDEFNEWFSKDIESHAENKTGIDEKHLSRLHMILKPFMLRRIKKDVENELSDKIEVMVYCPLTQRQQLLYMALKKKIRIEDLLHYTTGAGGEGGSFSFDKNFTSNLMNLVMQFRKVCNHPELFERRDVKLPLSFKPNDYVVPRLVYDNLLAYDKSIDHLVYNRFYMWTPQWVHGGSHLRFARFLGLSPNDLYRINRNFGEYLFLNHTTYLERMEKLHHRYVWWNNHDRIHLHVTQTRHALARASVVASRRLKSLVFTEPNFYTFTNHMHLFMEETSEHKLMRARVNPNLDLLSTVQTSEREPVVFTCQPTGFPSFLLCFFPKVQSPAKKLYCSRIKYRIDAANVDFRLIRSRYFDNVNNSNRKNLSNEIVLKQKIVECFERCSPSTGWFSIAIPDKETLVTDAGKLAVLDSLLKKLKKEGHRVLIYSQMTKMIDLLEEYMWHRKLKYMRLDGSSKISERRDMVADFQARVDIFVFLLSTRAGGLGINLTAADTVIFYDSDWNPTVDQQAMDRAHRLGQTKQVTVYRLICKNTIEERILQRAREKSEIQRMVISGGDFKPDTLKPKEVVSLLLDDEEIEMKYRQKAEERKYMEELKDKKERERKRKPNPPSDFNDIFVVNKRVKAEDEKMEENAPSSPSVSDDAAANAANILNSSHDDSSNEGIDVESTSSTSTVLPVITPQFLQTSSVFSRQRSVRGSRRGRPRGGRQRTPIMSSPSSNVSTNQTQDVDVTYELLSTEEVLLHDNLIVDETQTSEGKTSIIVKRGPGRPRLKTSGPVNQGSRSSSGRSRKTNQIPPLRSHSFSPGQSTVSGNSSTPAKTVFRIFSTSPSEHIKK